MTEVISHTDADESASLVHVDSNASMGSWLAEFLPEQARGKASLCKQDDVGAEGNVVEINYI